MKPVLVVYATREGHTRKIAEHVAATLRARGHEVDVIDAGEPPAGLYVSRYQGVVLAASLHLGRYEHEMIEFVRTQRGALAKVPTAFLSVSLAEAEVEDPGASFEARADAAIDVKAKVDAFCAACEFQPSRVWPVAGALLYTKYGALTRLVMRMIARRVGRDTDTTHDFEYTDWVALDRFVASMASEIEGS